MGSGALLGSLAEMMMMIQIVTEPGCMCGGEGSIGSIGLLVLLAFPFFQAIVNSLPLTSVASFGMTSL